MAEVIYNEATRLRIRLEELARERGDLREAERELNRQIGNTLIEVREVPGLELTLTRAADLLGISRPTAYRLLEEAER